VEVNTLDAVSGQQSADAVEVCENVFISEQTATCATYSINRLVFITEMKSTYCAVWTGSLNKAVCASSLTFWHPSFTFEF
jgi:L-fucose mutarotase/ribose pyranase (RbsD/FucU family)